MRSRIKYTNNLLHKNINNNNNFIVDDFYEEINDIDINVKEINDIDIINNKDINDIDIINDINEAKNISIYSYFLFVILYYMWIFLV